LSNTFLSKVVVERAALAVVNHRYPGNRQLSGLSSAAIEQWRSKVSLATSNQVVQTLVKLGEAAQTLSNKSNESFTPLTTDVKAALDQLMEELAASVNVLHSEG
jgi:predicted RNA-binding Zn ribbon-like protein